MNPISKIAIALVAVALVIVLGLIAATAFIKPQEETMQPTPEPTAQATIEPTAEPTDAPEEEALEDDAQAEGEMYEGALAGLSEEEIGKLALAEEQGHSEETGEESADEQGEENEAVAGVAD